MCRSFTHALGIPICAKLTPWVEGTLEFFEEGGDSKKPLLVTARHAIFHQTDNEPFERKLVSQKRHNVLVLSETSFQQLLVFIDDNINT